MSDIGARFVACKGWLATLAPGIPIRICTASTTRVDYATEGGMNMTALAALLETCREPLAQMEQAGLTVGWSVDEACVREQSVEFVGPRLRIRFHGALDCPQLRWSLFDGVREQGCGSTLARAIEYAKTRGYTLTSELQDLDTLVNHVIRTARVEVGAADTRVLTEELSKEEVLSIIGHPLGVWEEDAHEYARGLLLKLGEHMARVRVQPSEPTA